MNFNLNESPVRLEGKLDNMMSYLLFPDKNIKVNMKMSSPHFNLNKLLVKGEHKKSEIKKKPLKPFMGHLHKIISKMEVDFNVDIKKFEYKKFITNSVRGNVSVTNLGVNLNKWNLELSDRGRMTLNAAYIFQDNDSGKVKIEAQMKNVDASKLFYGFDNFGQSSLKSDNLAGLINSKIKFDCVTNKSFEPVQKTIRGNMSLNLKEGQLMNFIPLKKLGDLVFKNRDLMHIHFDEISNILILEGEELYIEKMIVNSSVLSLYLEGIFSFKDKTDISIQIPLSNLKDHNSEYFKIKDVEHGNLRLRAREKDGKMNVGLDVFDRFHKKPKEL